MALRKAAMEVGKGIVKAGEVVIKHLPTDKVDRILSTLKPQPGKEAPAEVKVPKVISVPPTPVALVEESWRPLAVSVSVYYSFQDEVVVHAAPRRPYLDPAVGLRQVLFPAAAAAVTRLAAVTSAAACAAAPAAGPGPIPAGLIGRRDLFLPLPPPVQPLHPIGYLIALAVALYPLPPRSLI